MEVDPDMPFVLQGARRGGRIIAAALAIAAFAAGPAHAAGDIADRDGCTPAPTLTPAFAEVGDAGLYTPVPDAGLEAGAAGWTLVDGAAVVEGNEPWQIGGAADSRSLDLPAGATAITAPLCIDETYTHFRFFARNAGGVAAPLRVDAVYTDANGRLVSTRTVTHGTTSTAWRAVDAIDIPIWDRHGAGDAAMVAFRFTTAGDGAHYLIDDVYVDPWAR